MPTEHNTLTAGGEGGGGAEEKCGNCRYWTKWGPADIGGLWGFCDHPTRPFELVYRPGLWWARIGGQVNSEGWCGWHRGEKQDEGR